MIARTDNPSLWSTVPLVILCVVTSLIFWISPLGLGFNDQAADKFRSEAISHLFTFMFWLGPISIGLVALLFSVSLFGFIGKTKTNWIIAILMTLTIIGQVATLIYLTG